MAEELATPLVERDDASDDFLSGRQFAQAEEVISRWRRRLATPSPELPQGQATPLAASPTTPEPQPGDARKALRAVTNTASQLPRGVILGTAEMFRAGDDLADWLNTVFPVSDTKPGDPSTPGRTIAADLEKVAEMFPSPKGEVQQATQEAVKWLWGFTRGAKLMGGLGGGAAAIGKGAAAGAFSDFFTQDPHGERLADLWQKLGLPENVLTDYLADDKGDSAIEGRFKNALEGVLAGGLAEGVLLAAKGVRAGMRTRAAEAEADPLAEARAQFGEVTDRDFLLLGDPNKPLLEVTRGPQPEALAANQRAGKLRAAEGETETGVPDQVAAAGLAKSGAEGGEEVFVNFARIDTADDVKSVIGQMADAFRGKVDEARRGVQSNEETARLADQLGMTVGDLLSRRKGQPFNAEEALAARRLWAASAEKLTEAARRAASPNAGAVDQFNFRKMMAVHYAIQAEVIGARTETARALQAWAIPAGGSVEKARTIQTLIDGMGGPEASAAMARRLAILAEHGSPAAVSQFVRKGWAATSVDAIREVWVNALLSSPKTHVVNTASNMLIAFQQIYERKAGEAISALRGADGDGIAPGEAAALAYGMIGAVPDAMRLFAKAIKTGQTGASLGKIDLPLEPSVSAEAFRMQDNAAGRFVDFLGTVARVPSRLLGAEDEFFKSIGYRMNLRAEALRMAFSEGHRDKALADRVAEIISDPPEHLRLSAADAALYQTFTQKPGSLGQGLMLLREKVPLSSFVLPFVRTPVNIAGYAFERSPLAPLNARWRADIAAGGARRDLALARLATGSMIMLWAADMADSGVISGRGPDDPGEREARQRQGWQPYSVKVGDRWYSFNRAEPFGMTMGFAADIAELVRRGEIEADEMDEVHEIVGAMIAPVANAAVSKTYMRGLAEFVEMMADSDRYAPEYIGRFMGSFVPAGVAALESALDPAMRETNQFSDYITSRIAGLSEKLTARRNLWGEVVKPDSGLGTLYDTLSPVQASRAKESPADAEIERLNIDLRRITKKTNWDGVPVNLREWPKVYERYVTLAGNELKHPAWGLGLKDLISSVVSGNHDLSEVYRLLPDTSNPMDGGKAGWIAARVQEYRRLARQAIIDDPEFSEFAEAIGQSRDEAASRRGGVILQ